ncbi:MAG: hypothetical protein R3C97_13430 [Geminicoccaceae bacterium]
MSGTTLLARPSVEPASSVEANAMPRVMLAGRERRRRIATHDLSAFRRPVIAGNRSLGWRMAWYAVNAVFFQGSLTGLLPSKLKAHILRLFGARVGTGLVVKPRVTIKYPWFLHVGDHVWIGEKAWIDNHCEVRLGSHVCISQGAYLFTGNHDWNDRRFGFFCRPVRVGEGAWIGAFTIVPPGSDIPPGTVIACAPHANPKATA